MLDALGEVCDANSVAWSAKPACFSSCHIVLWRQPSLAMASHEHGIFGRFRDAFHIVDDTRNPLRIHESWVVVALDGVVHTFGAFHANAVKVDTVRRIVGNHHIEVVAAQSTSLFDALLHVANVLLKERVEVVVATARIRQIHDDGALLLRCGARSCKVVGNFVVTGGEPTRCHERE